MRNFLFIPLFLLFLQVDSYGQIKKVKAFGDKLTKTLIESDTASYYALALPVDVAIETYRPQIEAEVGEDGLEEALQNVREYYPVMVEQEYGPYFINMRNTIEVFELKLEDIEYEIYEMEMPADSEGMIPVLGRIPHEKWKYLCFYAYEHEGEMCLPSGFVMISETNLFEEGEELMKFDFSADDAGMLQAVGKLELAYDNASPAAVRDCIMDGIVLVGIEQSSRDSDAPGEFEFISGKWDYGYYVNDIEEYVGSIAFDFNFKIFEDHIAYSFSNFVHSSESDGRKALGRLPYEVNDEITEVFNEFEWEEIMVQLYDNHVSAIRRATRTLDDCFE